MNAVITGANGFIGSHLAKRLLEEGFDVLGVDIATSMSELCGSIIEKNPKYKYLTADIVDVSDQLEKAIKKSDIVFHLAASVGIPNYLNSPFKLFQVNVIGSFNIINLCLKYEKKLIFSSTSEIYGKNPDVPWSEESDRVLGNTLIMRWNYSTSKSTIEHLLNSVKNNLNYKIVRFFNVYGPGQNPIFAVSRSIHAGMNVKDIQMYDGGIQTRCFTYIDDAIDATFKVSSLVGGSNTFNIGNNVEVTIKDVMDLVSCHFPKSKIINIETEKLYGINYEDLSRRVPNIERLNKETGWLPNTQIRDGVQKFVDWAHQNKFWYQNAQ